MGGTKTCCLCGETKEQRWIKPVHTLWADVYVDIKISLSGMSGYSRWPKFCWGCCVALMDNAVEHSERSKKLSDELHSKHTSTLKMVE